MPANHYESRSHLQFLFQLHTGLIILCSTSNKGVWLSFGRVWVVLHFLANQFHNTEWTFEKMILYKSGVRWCAEIGNMVLWFYGLLQHESDLHSLAQALLEHETLNAKEIKDLLNPLQLVPELEMAAVGSGLHNSASWTWAMGCFKQVRPYIQNLSGRIFYSSPLYCCIFLELTR